MRCDVDIGGIVLNILIDDIIEMHYRQFLELAVSPDDSSVLVVFGNGDMPHGQYAYDERNRSIWKCGLDGDETLMLVSSDEDAHAPCWSTDGNRIAYISCLSGKPEIWVMNSDGSHKKQVTQLNCFQGRDALNGTRMSWSSDDSFIVFTAVPNGGLYGLWQDTKHADRTRSAQTISVLNSTRNDSFERAKSVFEGAMCRLSLDSGEVTTLVSQQGTGFKLINWLKDREHLLFSLGNEIRMVNVRTGEHEAVLSNIEQPYVAKVVGNQVAVARPTQQGVVIGNVIDGDFHQQCEVSIPGFEFQLHSWSNDASRLFVSSHKGVSNVLYAVNVAEGQAEQLTEDEHVVFSYDHRCGVHALNLSNAAVFPYSSPTKVTELWRWEEQQRITQVSAFNQELAPADIPSSRVIRYRSGERMIEALVVLPTDYIENQVYPTLIYLHGGPETHVNASFTEVISARAQSAAIHLANNGYVVLLPNCRGSDGYGAEFESEIGSYRIMNKPYQDAMAGVDYLIQQGIADPDSLGIYGSSYGAQLTAWTVSQTQRFKGAVCAVGAHYDALFVDRYHGSSFLTYRSTRKGNADKLDLWLKPELMREISPIEHIASVDTPILMIETAAEQGDGYSYAKPFFNGLAMLGKEVYLVNYPEAFHNGGWNDVYKKDYMQRLLAWFDYCLKGSSLPASFISPTADTN